MDQNQDYGDTWELPPAWSEDANCYNDYDPKRQLNIKDPWKVVEDFCFTLTADLPQGQSLSKRKGNVYLQVTARKGEPHERCANGIPFSHVMGPKWCEQAFDDILNHKYEYGWGIERIIANVNM